MEKGKIDSRQAVFLNITMIIATALLVVPAMTTAHANQDAWLSSVLAALLVLPIAWITVKLSSLFPGKTIIEYLEEILGRWPAKVIGFLYLFWFVHICSLMIREYGDFIVTAFMPETPLIVFHIVVVTIGAYTIKQGLEVLARTNQIFLPLILFSLVMIMSLATPEKDLNRLLPVLEASCVDIFKGSLAPLAWFGEISTFTMIIPFLKKPTEAWRIAFISILLVGFIFTLLVIGIVTTFGPSVAAMTYPVLNETRVINIAKVIERMDPVIMSVWVMGGFVKITFFYYVIVLGSAQWLKLSEYRPLTMPVGIILLALSMAIADNLLESIHFLANVWVFYAISTFELGIPLVLLIIAVIRGRGGNNN
uniref:GerAB/ArcD/ProY family transporter n=1 Tax=Desulforadius tongensis TaxID=1216062 RepID=UPI001EE56DB9|nr:endospore germination permease [Desulforadius tongensis]